MKIIIAGAGQVGTTLAESLCHEHDVTIIDLNAQNLKRLNSRLDLKTIQGSASWPHILEQANASEADMIIAVTDNDECNIVTCLIAKSLFKIPTKIARIRYHYLEEYQPLLIHQNVIDMDQSRQNYYRAPGPAN
jgi:trk system potassium uptake protein TrkA